MFLFQKSFKSNSEKDHMKKEWSKSNKLLVFWILAIILLGAAALRLYNLEEESLWLDECFTLDYASKSFTALVETLKKDVHPIGYYLPQHLLIDHFGTGEISLRILSVFFGVLSILLTYLLARKLFSWKEGLLAAFFMSISYTSILYSQEAKMYSMFAAFFLLSLITFIRFLERPSYFNSIFFSISMALVLYTHIIGLGVLLMYILFYATSYILREKTNSFHSFTKKREYSLSRFYAVLTIIFLLYLPWLKILFFYQLPLLHDFLGMKLIEKTGINLLPVVLIIAVLLCLGYAIFLYLALVGKINLREICGYLKRISSFCSSEKILFLLMLSFIILDFVLSKYLFSSVSIVRFCFFLLPFLYLTLSRILIQIKRNVLAIILFSLFILSASVELHAYYSFDSKEQFHEAAEYVESHANSADVLFLHRATIAKLCFDYYYSNNVEEVRLINPGLDDYLLLERTSGKENAYLILSHNYHTKDYFKQKLDSLYELTEEQKFIGVTVYKYKVKE